ncbi:hypothetical protein [Desulfofundulus sp.]|uniref:hypothetical protein n=1 Tax=Desulfofundulus sp. TaxID=2282750 RepID=UPI003C739A3E
MVPVTGRRGRAARLRKQPRGQRVSLTGKQAGVHGCPTARLSGYMPTNSNRTANPGAGTTLTGFAVGARTGRHGKPAQAGAG